MANIFPTQQPGYELNAGKTNNLNPNQDPWLIEHHRLAELDKGAVVFFRKLAKDYVFKDYLINGIANEMAEWHESLQ